MLRRTISTFRIVAPNSQRAAIVAHVPHASAAIPDEFRRDMLLGGSALTGELLRMTDWHTDALFDGVRELGATLFVNQLSRLVVDPERFADDEHEPNAEFGQGAVYTRTSQGAQLRRLGDAERQRLLDRVYTPYHAALSDLVAGFIEEFGRCLVLDCHSFGSVPLPSEKDQSAQRPDICIGTDSFHTSADLAERFEDAFRSEGLSVARDRPFTGALVPLTYYGRDRRVSAVMVEVRRGVYCDEETGEPVPDFGAVKAAVVRAVSRAVAS